MKSTLNWKHTLFHFLGFWGFGYAFRQFAFLNNIDAAETVRLSKNEFERLTSASLSKLSVTLEIGFFIGYVVALFLGLFVSGQILKKGSYRNTLIAFLLFYILLWLDWTGWRYLKTMFSFPGSLFDGWLHYTMNGVVLLALGSFFIFRVKCFYSDKNGSSPTNLPYYA